MVDVLVIGGGLAGTMAALVARQQGAQVVLATRSYGATALSSGALDLAYTPAFAYDTGKQRTLREHIQDIAMHRVRHPYGILGVPTTLEGLRQGLTVLREATPQLFGTAELNLDEPPGIFGSSLGVLRAASHVARSHVAGDFFGQNRETWAVVQMAADPFFRANHMIRGWTYDAKAFGLPQPNLRTINVEWPSPPNVMAQARGFDDLSAVDQLAGKIKPKLQDVAKVIIPPVLGLHRFTAAKERLEQELGIPVAECLAHVPSVPGLRLQLALDQACLARGVRSCHEIAAAHLRHGLVDSVEDIDGNRLRAQTYILASGRFISQGIQFASTLQESLFGLPVVTEQGDGRLENPLPFVRRSPDQSHPLMTAGVAFNKDLQPLVHGEVAYKNLFAAGMVLSGFASRFVLCADGVALTTGWLAAIRALGLAGAKQAA